MNNPSAIDLGSLPWLPLTAKSAFPSQPAVYFALDAQDNILYIGRTKNVRSRWSRHHKYHALSAITNVKVAYLFLDAPLLPDLERVLIQHYKKWSEEVAAMVPSQTWY